MRDGVRTLIKLDSPDRPASSASQPKAGESTKPAAQQGKKPLPAPLHAKRQAAADKGARSAGQGLGIKSGGGVTKAAPEKLKKVMKKGKLPEFSFDSRSIFINRKAAASKPQPGALPQKKDRPPPPPPPRLLLRRRLPRTRTRKTAVPTRPRSRSRTPKQRAHLPNPVSPPTRGRARPPPQCGGSPCGEWWLVALGLPQEERCPRGRR